MIQDIAATESRTTSFVPILLFTDTISSGVNILLSILERSCLIAVLPKEALISMVVRETTPYSLVGRLEKPTIEKSLGIVQPADSKARIAPMAIISSSETKAVGKILLFFNDEAFLFSSFYRKRKLKNPVAFKLSTKVKTSRGEAHIPFIEAVNEVGAL